MGGDHHAAAEAARLRLVRRRRRVGRAGDAGSRAAGATRATSCRRSTASALRRIDVAPDGRRGALLGLELTQPRAGTERTVDRDGRRALRADDAVPVGLRAAPCRTRATTRPTPARTTAARSSSATPAGSRARPRTTPTRRSSAPTARAVGGETGPGPLRAVRRRARAARRRSGRRRCRASATTARSAAAPAGSCATGSSSAGHDSETLWVAVAGSENSAGEARSEFARLTRKPERLVAEKLAARRALARRSRVAAAGRPAAAGVARVGQAEPRRPHADGRGRRPPLDERGQGVDARGLARRA